MYLRLSIAASLAAFATQPVDSQTVSAPVSWTYADLADVAIEAPVAVHVRVARTERIGADRAPNVAQGYTRFLIQADVVALIRGDGGLASRVSYLVDLANDSRGRPLAPRRRSEMLILAQRVPARPLELRLVSPDAQIPYSPEAAERLRAILRESSAAGAPPRITGIGRAFHVPGSLPGESESQIFLQTADQRPISLSVLRRPGQQPRWSVALGEMVDEAAGPPVPDTLLWYRLACTLPAQLPAAALREAGESEADAIRGDYRVVTAGLGECARTRVRR
jgi:hypothetical protein